MSLYSKINIISEYITPNGYLFSGYSQQDLPEIFLNNLQKIKDFDVHLTRSTRPKEKYELRYVDTPFLNYLKEYKSKFSNEAHRVPIVKFKLPYQINETELKTDILNIVILEADTISVHRQFGFNNFKLAPATINLIKNNKNCILLIMDWREGSYEITDKTIELFNGFVSKNRFKKEDVFFVNNNFQIKKDSQKYDFSVATFPWYILMGFDPRLYGRADSMTNKELTFVKNDDAFNSYSNIRKYKFLSYNRNSNRLHRPYVISKLYNDGILKESLVSLYESRALSEYDTVLKSISNLEFETLKFSKEDREILKKFVDESYPLKLDHDNANDCARANNQISTKEHFLNSYFNIVCETSCHSDYTFITEKTLRPIINLQPFIIFGNPYTLKSLKELGFKTFDKWVDESYDLEINTNKRFELAYNEILKISKLDIDEIHEIYFDMFEVLEHNFNNLVKIYQSYLLPEYLGNTIYKALNKDLI